MKKFELTNEFVTNMFGTKLFRIRALVEFGDVEPETWRVCGEGIKPWS